MTLGSRPAGSPTRGEGNGLLLPTVIELARGAGRLTMGELAAGVKETAGEGDSIVPGVDVVRVSRGMFRPRSGLSPIILR